MSLFAHSVKGIARFWVMIVGMGLVALHAVAEVPSSSSFMLSQATVGGAGGSATSTTFVLDGTMSQSSTIGTSNSGAFVLQSGFWTHLSTRLVLQTAAAGSGTGAVIGALTGTGTSTAISCFLDGGTTSGECTETLTHGTTIDLIAAPDPGNRFDGWTGCDSLLSTTLDGDTCRVTLYSGRTVTAALTALGLVGDIVWRDLNGDGIQDSGEPGLSGIGVTIDDGNGLTAQVTTNSAGGFSFFDVPPGDYDLSVDPTTLPIGVVPTFDFDGTATPHTSSITVFDGENLNSADFGYQPLTDLTITMSDSEDPLPGGNPLTFTLTIQNLGPGVATGVVVTDFLPSATTFIASGGCAEDPGGAPICTLGTMGVGASSVVTLEVEIDPAPPSSITNTATVSAIELDVNPVTRLR